MVVGDHLFKGDSVDDKFYSIVNQPIALPRDLSENCQSVIMNLLDRNR